jgi:protein-tyrosine phosphatase
MRRLVVAAIIAAVIAILLLKFQDEQTQMSEVAPGLLISDWWAATDEGLLRSKGVTAIICMNERHKTTRDEDIYARLGIRHHHFSIPDRPHSPISLIFRKTFQIINDEILNGGRVLVHCRAGVSRSVTIAAAYLMQKNNWGRDEAINQIRTARRIAWPNHGFRAALAQLENVQRHRAVQQATCDHVFA